MAQKTYLLVCRRKNCDVVIKQKVDAKPLEGWHEHDDLGRKETHLMDVVDPDEVDSG